MSEVAKWTSEVVMEASRVQMRTAGFECFLKVKFACKIVSCKSNCSKSSITTIIHKQQIALVAVRIMDSKI